MPFPPLVEPVAALSPAERTRTARHAALAGFGELSQRRLAAARVAVVGAGGLGSPVVLALAAAGVGELVVIDDDDVEQSNLHRQILHRHIDIGTPKVDSAVRVAADLAPGTVVHTVRERLTPANAQRILRGAHVVVDGTDTFETRAAVAAATEALGVPLVWGTLQEFDAQVTVFWSTPPEGRAPVRLADLYPPDSVGEVPTCAQVGVLGALCVQVGGLLAIEAIKLVAGIGEPLFGRVLLIDSLRARQHEIPLRPAASTPTLASPTTGATASTPAALVTASTTPVSTASTTPVSTAPASVPAASTTGTALGTSAGAALTASATDATRAAGPPPQISPALLDDRRAAGAVVLDVREPYETDRGTIAGAVLLPLAEVLTDPAAAGPGPFVVVCQAGVRAQRAAVALQRAGATASVLAGGMDAWQATGHPVAPQANSRPAVHQPPDSPATRRPSDRPAAHRPQGSHVTPAGRNRA